jgi:ApbE superfamily uncharacterized protein (UPF0280 family)
VRKIIKQSNLLLISESLTAIDAALRSVVYHRCELEDYILLRPEYRYSLEPVRVEEDAPRVVKLAASATQLTGVGPMAAIPGALAELALESMLHRGAEVNVIENGGEIAAASRRPLCVGIYAGPSPLSGKVGFQLSPEEFPVGIATSSATVSHALNFGEADAAVVIADTASLADAAAKAVCNVVQGEDVEASVQAGLEVAEDLPCVRASLIIRGKYIGTAGRLPKLVRLDGDVDEMLKIGLHDLASERAVIL